MCGLALPSFTHAVLCARAQSFSLPNSIPPYGYAMFSLSVTMSEL